VARDHITRAEFRQDMKQLIERLDNLSLKLDALRERRANPN
jgi:DNA-binding NtrC family response regulator